MSAQPLLLPSLYALLPSPSHQTLTSHLSLHSIHVDEYTISESVYLPTTTVIPNQIRPLRLQATRRSSPVVSKGKGKASASEIDASEGWDYGLAYVSAPLQGREYSEMSVRGFLGVEVVAGKTRVEIEEWVELLGYRLSHSHTRGGLLFHLPLPQANATLHLSITRLALPSNPNPPPMSGESGEPYLVELRPAKPQQPVPGKGDVGIQEMMRLMKDASERISGLEWGSGR